jgi:hypothetical protein
MLKPMDRAKREILFQIGEVVLILLWTIFVGRAYLNPNPMVWPVGVELHTVQGAAPLVFSQTVAAKPDPRPVVFEFGNTYEVSTVSLEVQNVLDSEPAHIHVWEVTLK